MNDSGDRLAGEGRIRCASLPESLKVAGIVLVPLMMQGVLQRRPWAVSLLARLDVDRWGNRVLRRLRRRHGGSSVLVNLLGRRMVVLLSPGDVHRVLEGSPQPFTLDNREKHASLSQFEPHGVLISTGPVREARRAYNEEILDTAHPVHRLGETIGAVVREEAGVLLGNARAAGGVVTWPLFAESFWRTVRRVVLGDAARDDVEVTGELSRLRADANWSYLRRPRPRVREAMMRRIRTYVGQGQAGCLAALVAATPAGPDVDPVGQMTQWLFAFDGAGTASFRLMALLATHPEQERRADADRTGQLDYLRACVLDCLRLWPTTLVVLRDGTEPIRWGTVTVPAGTAFAAPSSFLHRDEELLPYAHRFAPEIWLDGTADDNWSLIPFSGGPGVCPGRNLVLLVTSVLLAELRREHRFTLRSRPALTPQRPLPYMLNHGAIRLGLAPR
ncbi:cytochrome P450 [Rugosimonospora africana]|uniref:Cytochrome P450 n=1 Tax=Rugosimonospora africana TaxID=556532 RepID=A0A8J3QPG7_9ACTN|nr:cytochrome P450 [Rugosimonospora africana]GIH15045.1 cytochrome P450 [Rugosimonospora africana]